MVSPICGIQRNKTKGQGKVKTWKLIQNEAHNKHPNLQADHRSEANNSIFLRNRGQNRRNEHKFMVHGYYGGRELQGGKTMM